MGRLDRLLAGAVHAALVIMAVPAGAGTTGKIAGKVTDAGGNPVAAATIQIVGTRLGAYANAAGEYSILSVQPGTYEVSIGRIGFRTTIVQSVLVSADQTAQVDAVLEETAVETEEVIVVAQRPVVEVDLTSSRTTLTTEEIEALPVQDLDDIVNLQAGVVEGHFRGGREGEVQYQVDGSSVNNVYNNASIVQLDRSLLQEVQIISGTFDAEYGQAMSGVVNAVLKEGGDRFEWSGEVFGGAFVYPENESDRIARYQGGPGSIQNYQLSLSGPTGLPNTTFLLSGRRYVFDDWISGVREFVPTDSADFANNEFDGTGDSTSVPLGMTREWSGVVKITNRSIDGAKISYQALFNQIDSRRTNFNFRLNPDGLSNQETVALNHGLDWSHTLSPSTYLNLALRQNLFEYSDYAYENINDTRYDEAGPPRGDSDYALGAYVQGVDFTRFIQNTNAFLATGSVTSQVTHHHQIRAGTEIQVPQLEFGTPGHLVYTLEGGVLTLVRKEDEPGFPAPAEYQPFFGSAFAQDNMEWENLKIRAGLRVEVFDANSFVPSDLSNPADTIQGAPSSPLVPTTVKTRLSPRLGVAYPITQNAAAHFAYGHFYQMPALGLVFDNADYSVLATLQASTTRFAVMGNPDIKPESTIQYEIGYKHALNENLGLDVTAFYKDIRDLLGVEFISTYNDAEYARFTNVDFGSVLGFTVAVDHRRVGPASVSFDYTWQQAQGNSSDPRETATRAEAGSDPRPRLVPFDWDQTHTFNMTLSVGNADKGLVSGVVRAATGQPYTPESQIIFGSSLEPNSGRKPGGVLVDLRAEKGFNAAGARLGLFTRVFNVFDSRYFNGFVFNTTGSPYYTYPPGSNLELLADPTRFYSPRRLEIGLTIRNNS